ncbi:MAG: fibrobacter succinogenes major paralogous domain-containing protein [Bacteroidetes bacterium]|nr:fibrobacter succinogenes major paralogous domain-containing protein [Bacteroidota bacterium]
MKTQILNIGLLLAILGLAVAIFTSCKEESYEPETAVKNIEVFDDTKNYIPADDYTNDNVGVQIGNTTWAKNNIDNSGNFAAYTYNAGGYYQAHDIDRNPCPAGWRVPTSNEFESLLDTTHVTSKWTVQNGINGWEFTDKESKETVFFPAQGYNTSGNASYSVGKSTSGYYWSSTGIDDTYANSFGFNKNNAFMLGNNRTYGQAVRCVEN